MSKKIETYQDLLDEKAKMEGLMKAQKDLLRMDMMQLRGEFRPAIRAVRVVGKLFSREKDRSVIGVGTERLIDFVFQKFILNKAGWLARFVVPILVKNVSSHVVSEKRQGWVQKLKSWIGKKNHNGQTPPHPDPAATSQPPKTE